MQQHFLNAPTLCIPCIYTTHILIDRLVSVKVPERSQHPFIDEPLKIIKVDKQDMLDNKEKQSLEELVDPILPVHLPPFTQFNLAKETKI